MLKRMLVMLAAVAVFAGGIGFWKMRQIQAAMEMNAKFGPPPAAVTTVLVEPQKWQPTLRAVGSLKAVNGVTISTDLAGVVSSEIAFESGAPVKKGDALITLDTAQEDAALRLAEARLALAKNNHQRQRELVTRKLIAQADWDSAEAELRQAQATVDEAKALATRKRIKAPFDGVAGIRQVNLGQFVNAGASIVPLHSMDPIHVEFALPQQFMSAVHHGGKIRLTSDGTREVQYEGDINAIDSHVDDASRNFMVQGTVQNPEHQLRPGMFVNVEVLLPTQDGVLAVPSSAINYAPYGDSVFVVKEAPGPDGHQGKQVVQQFVKLGATRGDQVTVATGIKSGDEIVSSGTFKLRSGSPVIVDNRVQPGNALQPAPADN